MDCYFDTNGCLVCPAIPAAPAQPASVRVLPNLGWNAGANSVHVLSGDVSLKDALTEAPAGIVIGLKTSRLLQTEPTLIDHALYFYTVAGVVFVEIHELGVQVGQAVEYPLGTPFEIRRIGSTVLYFVGGLLLATAAAKSLLPVLVNTCLYSAGDLVP